VGVQCYSSIPAPATTLAGFVAQDGTASATAASVSHLDSFVPVPGATNDGVLTRQYTLTDACGQMANCNQIITVDDTVTPVVTFWPPNRTTNVNLQCFIQMPDLTVEVVASDNCGPLTITQNPISGTTLGPGTYPVLVTVSDQGGNSTNHTTTLTVQDVNSPHLATYVDDDYISLPTGTVVTWPYTGGSGTHYIGCDAFATIQGGVDRVDSGGTVQVAAGTYNEDVGISKSISVLGAGAGNSIVVGPIGGPGSTFFFTAAGIVLDGFTVTRAGNNTTDWNNPNLNSAGLSISGGGNGTLRNCVFTGNRTGIDINNVSGTYVLNNVITNNRTGMIMRNITDNLTVLQNVIADNWTVGILFLDASSGSNVPQQRALNCFFTSNNISGNWYGQVVDRQTGGSLPAPGANLKNFSGNWYGTPSPVVTIANSTEPGYAAQIPVVYGGAAVPPGGQPDIAGPASPNIDYTPWLSLGTDTSVAFGFQGDFSDLHVDDNSPQTGSTGRVQEGVNMIADGSLTGGTRVVHVEAGTYVEQVEVTRDMQIAGVGASSIIKSPNTLPLFYTTSANNRPVVFVHNTDGGTVRDLTVDGDGKGNGNNRMQGVGYYRSGGLVANLTVKGVR